MSKISDLRRLPGDTAPPKVPRSVRLTLRVDQDVAEALALGKVRGEGTLSEQVETLVRARENTRR